MIAKGLHFLLLGLCILALACGTPTKTGTKESQPPATDLEVPNEFRNQRPSISEAQAVHFLPDSTIAAFFVQSPAFLESPLGLTPLLRAYLPGLPVEPEQLTTKDGFAVMDPSTWSKAGIDTTKPMGAAFLVASNEAFVFCLTLTDGDAFLAHATELAASFEMGAVKMANSGNSRIAVLAQGSTLSIVVREQVAMIVLAKRKVDLPVISKALAGATSDNTLASTGRVAKAFANFDFGEDFAGFVAFDSIGRKIASEERARQNSSWHAEQLRRLEEELSQQDANLSTNDRKRLEEQIVQAAQEHAEYQLRDAAEIRFLESFLQEIGTVSFGMDLHGPNPLIRARLQMDPLSLPGRMLTSTGAPLDFFSHLRGEPVFALGARVNGPAALELTDIILQMDGDQRSEIIADVQTQFGLNLIELVANLQGEMGAAVLIDSAKAIAQAQNEDAMGNLVTVHLEATLRDPLAAQAMLDQAASAPKMKRFVAEVEGKVALQFPSFNNRPIVVSVKGNRLVAKSLSEAELAPLPAAMQGIVGASAAQAAWIFDPMLFGWLTFRSMGDFDEEGDFGDLESRRESRKTLRAKRKELERIQTQSMVEASADFGKIVLVARPGGAFVNVHGSLQGRQNFIGGLRALIEMAAPELKEERTGKPDPTAALKQEIRKLQEQLWNMPESMSDEKPNATKAP